jgi:hypothetical protein
MEYSPKHRSAALSVGGGVAAPILIYLVLSLSRSANYSTTSMMSQIVVLFAVVFFGFILGSFLGTSLPWFFLNVIRMLILTS